MAMVTVFEGQRVAFGGKSYGPGESFDAGDLADSLSARGLVRVVGAGSTDPAPAPEPEPETVAAELPAVDEVPIGHKRRGRGYRKPQGDGD